MTTTSHTLYRFFDKGDTLLYVGRTVNPGRRWREHEKEKPWFENVATVKRETFTTAEEVDAAERAAIANEKPLHNIALNRGAHAGPSPKRLAIPEDILNTLAHRLLSIGEDGPDECEGDETVCECAECHHLRAQQLEYLASAYAWHPGILAATEKVEKSYYAGHCLSDWYYDLSDVQLFGSMALRQESQARPIPSFAEFDGQVAHVDCPFCPATHRHVLTAGMALDDPLTAPCQPMRGGLYLIETDWLTALDGRYRWGVSSRIEAA